MGKAVVPEAIADLEIDHKRYHKCETCHTTIDIPTQLYMRLDSGVFQNDQEVNQVDLNEDWHVGVYWCLLGRLAKCICVDWCVSVKFESMGDDREFETYAIEEADPCEYCWSLHVPAQRIVVTPRECADVYRIVVVVTARDKCNGNPVGITGFCDLGLVEFYTGKTGNG